MGATRPLMQFERPRIREELAPCGTGGLVAVATWGAWQAPLPDLRDCLARKPKGRPWSLVIWEPLPTKAPGPHLAQSYCCYIKTVKFYHRPYIVDEFTRFYRANGKLRPSKGGFLEWDELETRLTWDDIVEFQGERFKIEGGTVLWRQRRWWMRRWARRNSGGS